MKMVLLAQPRRHARTRRFFAQAGFGLVELMIALVLGLLIVGGVLNIFLSNQQVFRANEGLARLQENSRISFEVMAREVRQAGGNLCGARLVGNVLNNATTDWSSNWDAGTIIGFDDAQASPSVTTGTATANRIAGTDAILVMTGNVGSSAVIASHDAAAASIGMSTTTHGITADDLVMVCDGSSATIAQVTSVVGTAVFHLQAGTAPGNCSQGLGYPTDCSSTTGSIKTFEPGGLVSEFTAATWYVGSNGRGGQSLYRVDLDGAQEIAEGVTDMQIAYLLRDEATGNLDADWIGASAVTDWTTAAAKQVVAVRFDLTFQTSANVGTSQQPLTRHLIHVVNLRNRSI